MKRVILWVVIGVLAVLVIYTTFFKGSVDSNMLSAGKTVGQIASSGMVGGC